MLHLAQNVATPTLVEFLRSPGAGWMMVLVMIVAVVLIRSLAEVIKSVSRERTRREIAAYIAEGTMTPEQGERILSAGRKNGN
ncbi:MAG: hypothetical protein HRU70_02255 [Phycisphaeraceae bacterium]|nr:MAG: hypothetical protein HRU70_02255 [Phycisphaeraceae bacterium]